MPGTEVGEAGSPYAGRWVALVRGQVVAQGGTPEQALRAARACRHKEIPEVIFMSTAEPLVFSPLIEKILAVLPDDQPLYLVGGAVRDLLLNRTTHDLDFVVPSDGIKLGRRVADGLEAEFFPLDRERDTGRVILIHPDGMRDILDFATYRGADLESDLRSRDFTLNAMAIDVRTQALFDPLGGAADLRQRLLRACSETTFSDDPLRILRAVRQAAAFGFHIQPETRQAIRQATKLLKSASPERRRDELFRILEGPSPDASLRALEILGVLPELLPELPALKDVEQPTPHIYDVWNHTLAVLRELDAILSVLTPGYNADEQGGDLFTGLLSLRLGRYRTQFNDHFAGTLNTDRSVRALLFLAALYHDVAKPATRSLDESGRIRFFGHDGLGADMAARRGRDFCLSNDEIERLRVIIRNHMRVHFHTTRLFKEGKEPSRRAIYRFFRDSGPAGVDVILLSLADLRATYGPNLPQEQWAACLDVSRILLENWWERPQEVVTPPPLVNGHDLMTELGLQPGPVVGKVLEAIREAQATQKVFTRDEALEHGRQWLLENPLD
jgi:tRNA nucleotidyltransferase/poly(A) polymerase